MRFYEKYKVLLTIFVHYLGPIKWPLIGNVIEIALADPVYPHLAFCKLAKKYGPVFSARLGSHDACE